MIRNYSKSLIFCGILLLVVSFAGCDSPDPTDPGGGEEGGGNATYVVHVTDREFTREGPSYNWYSGSGSGRSYYWAVTSSGVPYNAARWAVPFSQPGRYIVSAAISTESGLTTAAPYTILANGNSSTSSVNQTMSQGSWVQLGTFYFAADGSEYVELHNNTGRNGYKIVFDSVMWEEVDSAD